MASIIACFIVLLGFQFSVAQATKQKKVVIIFNGGDSTEGSPLDRSFANIEKGAEAIYKKAGFDDVIVLSPKLSKSRQPTAINVTKLIQDLKDTSELHLEFISHGNIEASSTKVKPGGSFGMMGSPADAEEMKRMMDESARAQAEYERRYSPIPLTPKEGKLYAELNYQKSKYDQGRFSIASIVKEDSSSVRNDVGMGELKEAISQAQTKNPSLQTTIYTGACFSGGMARSFAEFPGVQTFVSSQAVVYGWGISDPSLKKSSDSETAVLTGFEEFFQNQLHAGRSYLDAHDEATKKYLEIVLSKAEAQTSLTSQISATVPRNGLQEHIINWCIKNSGMPKSIPDNNQCRQPDAVARLKRTNQISTDFYENNTQLKLCNQNAGLIAKIQDKRKSLMKKAFEFTQARLANPPNYQTVFNRIIKESSEYIKELKDEGSKNPPDTVTPLLKMSEQERRNHVEMLHSFNKEKLEANYNSCVNGKNSGYRSSCETRKIVSESLLPILNYWGAENLLDKIDEQESGIRDRCKTKGNIDKDNILSMLECLEKHADESPIAALQLSARVARYGSSCPLYFAAQDALKDDTSCIQSYEKFADCESWSRLKELYEMGSRKLAGERDVTSKPELTPATQERETK